MGPRDDQAQEGTLVESAGTIDIAVDRARQRLPARAVVTSQTERPPEKGTTVVEAMDFNLT